MVVAAVAVLEHAASVFAVFEQVRGIFGDHAHRTGKAAIACAYVVGAFFDFEALDQLGLDKNRALHVALKAAFGRTVDGQLHVFGFAQAPDIDGLATRFERAAEVDTGQRGQQARDVIGLVAVDFGLGHGRLADVAGVDLVTAAHHAERAEFEAVAGGGALLFGLHHVGFVDQDQVEIGVFEQSLDGVLRAVVAAQCRGFDVAQQRFVEQQGDVRLLRDVTQRTGQRLRRQLQLDRVGLGIQAERHARGEQGRAGAQIREVMWCAKHEIPQSGNKGQKRRALATQTGGRRGRHEKPHMRMQNIRSCFFSAVQCGFFRCPAARFSPGSGRAGL